jgi:transcriptional regulator with XRE-family HTH domain
MTTPDEHDRRQTAEVVMHRMRRRGLTRKIFADRLGKSMSWVDSYPRASGVPVALARLARATGVTA